MKLSKRTIEILKNFATINTGIVSTGGSAIKTMALARNIVGIAEVEENLPQFAIYNLNEFLGVIGLFKDPEFEFSEKWVTLSTETSKARYFFSDPSIITSPTKDIKDPEYVVSVTLEQKQIKDILKAATVLALPEISFASIEGNATAVNVVASDSKNPSSNNFTVVVPAKMTGTPTFNFTLKTESWAKIMESPIYTVELSTKNISKFVGDITYFISLEINSSSYTA